MAKIISLFLPTTIILSIGFFIFNHRIAPTLLQSSVSAPPVVYYDHVGDIPPPSGFTRLPQTPGSFGEYLRQIPLKRASIIHLFNGHPKANQSAHFAILDFDVGSQDLQQCADAVIRLRAEYLYSQQKFDQLKFHFTNGDLADFNTFSNCQRPVFIKNKAQWQKVPNCTPSTSYETFRKYLNLVYQYAGTSSLDQELPPRRIYTIEPGNVLIQTGQPYGHAMIVVDVAQNTQGQRQFMLAQSYMPAQDIHIVKNPANPSSPWYEIPADGIISTPEWSFNAFHLKQFPTN